MPQTAKTLDPCIKGLDRLIQVTEQISDARDHLPLGWVNENLTALESMVEKAEALHGALRRCCHLIRCNLPAKD